MFVWRSIFTRVVNKLSQNTILPFGCLGVRETIQLVHSNRFGIQNPCPNFFIKLFILQRSHSSLKNFITASFTATSWTYQHQSVTNLHNIIQLNDLHIENCSVLQIFFNTKLVDSLKKITIILVRLFYAREQIFHDVFKQRNIILQEFRYINITKSTQ